MIALENQLFGKTSKSKDLLLWCFNVSLELSYGILGKAQRQGGTKECSSVSTYYLFTEEALQAWETFPSPACRPMARRLSQP